MFMYRLSAQASDCLMEKQMTAYSVLVDTAEEKGGSGNSLLFFCVLCCMHYFIMRPVYVNVSKNLFVHAFRYYTGWPLTWKTWKSKGI